VLKVDHDVVSIRQPSASADVVKAIRVRKVMVSVWLALAVLFMCLFLAFSTSVSTVTEAISEQQQERSSAFS